MSTIEKAAERLAAKKAKDAASAGSGTAAAPASAVQLPIPPAPAARSMPSQPFAKPVADHPHENEVVRWLPETPRHKFEFDFEELASAGILTPDGVRSRSAQEFRKIKRQILNRIDRLRDGALTPTEEELGVTEPPRYNTFMVTSALSGEGKTYVATNLAMSLAAEVDREVILIDGDVAKADTSRHLGLNDRMGFGQVLRDPSRIGEALLGTNVPRLSILPAGEYLDNLDELLASELMGDLVDALAQQNPDRIVLFDAPPLLVTTEAAVLSRHLRQVLLVVEANRTPKDAVAQAVRELGDHPNVMMMLNKASGGSRFGYGYGYGYGQGGNITDTQETAAVAD